MAYQLRRRYVFSLAVLVLITLTGCIGVGSYKISGRVTDTEGNGLGGVRLAISGGTTGYAVTKADGKWEAKVTGTVTVTPEPQPGYLFTPPQRAKITKQSGSSLTFQRVGNKILWYMYEDYEHFSGGMRVIAPPDNVADTKYDIVVEENNLLTDAPTGYDVLVLSDVGASFDLSEFTGRVIVTLDSSIVPLMYWITGDYQAEVYWDYESEGELHWVKPVTGNELGAPGDARIYNSLDGVEGFTRRNDLIQAGSTEGSDDVVLYKIDNSKGNWWWLHVGPHFGNYDYEVTTQRVWEIINYALDLINGYDAVFPALPETTTTISPASLIERN
jgi:hypothetical protein